MPASASAMPSDSMPATAGREVLVQRHADHLAALRGAVERRDRIPRRVTFHLELGEAFALAAEDVAREAQVEHAAVLPKQLEHIVFSHRPGKAAHIESQHEYSVRLFAVSI